MFKRPERFCIKASWHHFVFSTRLMIISIAPAKLRFNIVSSYEIIAKTLSVALEVSLSIYVVVAKEHKFQLHYTVCGWFANKFSENL